MAVYAIMWLFQQCKVNHFPALFVVMNAFPKYKLLVLRELLSNFADNPGGKIYLDNQISRTETYVYSWN